MAEGLNKVLLLGNLGADPELRVTPGGQAVLKLRLATTESYLDKSNTRQERTEWHRITIWGKRGEALAKFLTKGERLFVEGRIQTSSYEKNGEKRYSTEIIANNVILAGSGRGRGDRPEGDQPRSSGRSAPSSGGRSDDMPQPSYDAPSDDFGGGGGGGGGGGDDEIPF
jgi:single-strand DNA-binding protein